ncbi:MAG: VOC family protein [Pseudomonadota bacterium]
MTPSGILETALYATDLDAAEDFYSGILGLEKIIRIGDRHVFFRCGAGVLLIFNPVETRKVSGPLPIPPHGAEGDGHVCFRGSAGEIAKWRTHLEAEGVKIESDFDWPQGGRSIYFRDPAGNSIEFAEPRIWGLE